MDFDADTCRDRSVIERSYYKLKQWRGLATRYDKLAVVFRGGAMLCSIFIGSPRYRETRLALRFRAPSGMGR